MLTRRALPTLLVAPLAVLTLLAFVVPIALLFWRAVDNSELASALPETASALRAWDGRGMPPETVRATLLAELPGAVGSDGFGQLTRRANFERTGMRGQMLRAARTVTLDASWDAPEPWLVLRHLAGPVTPSYFLRAIDLARAPDGAIARAVEDERVFAKLFARTLGVAALVAALAVLLAWPLAFHIVRLPPRRGEAWLALAMIPFWTSVLVRTAAWFVLLQREGPVNAALLAFGFIDAPVQLIFTRLAVVLAMTQMMLPFALLPIHAVLKRADPALDRAAASLGAGAARRLLAVHLPLSLPGVAAGFVTVFTVSAGFYVTPALVGGPGDQMLASFISFFVNQTVNFGMAAALAMLLLGLVFLSLLLLRRAVPMLTPR